MFKIGEKVVVVNEGYSYTTYKELALGVMELDKWEVGNFASIGSSGVVVNKGFGEMGGVLIYAVLIGDKHYLVAENGLERYEEDDVECIVHGFTIEVSS